MDYTWDESCIQPIKNNEVKDGSWFVKEVLEFDSCVKSNQTNLLTKLPEYDTKAMMNALANKQLVIATINVPVDGDFFQLR